MKLICVAFLVVQFLLTQAISKEVAEIIELLVHNPLNPEWVTPDIREELLSELHKDLTEYDKTHWTPRVRALVTLGDENFIADRMATWQKRRNVSGRGVLADGFPPQPSLIPYLSRNFFRDDGEDITIVVREGDLEHKEAPLSVSSAYATLGIIVWSDNFSPSAKAWARQTQEAVVWQVCDILKFREMMRQWWRENEGHFRRRDYAAVQPGAFLAKKKPDGDKQASAAARQATPSIGAVSPSPSGAAGPPSETTSSPYLFPLAVGFSLLAVGAGVVVWRRRRV